MPRTSARSGEKRRPAGTTRVFLFSDLRDYTPYVETHGDAAAARLLRDFRALVRREVTRHDGAEVKTEGDSFYVVFDSPSSALECAVAILRRAADREKAQPPLRIGIGIHAGEAVPQGRQYVGSAVNVASRMCSAAAVGEILVSDTFRGLVRTSMSYPFTEHPVLALKGIAEPMRAWTVRWAEQHEPAASIAVAPLLAGTAQPARPAAGQIVCPVVVGRDAERRRTDELLEAAAAGNGQTLIVGGEAGVGKSALVREVSAAASEGGFRILYGATLESDGGLPYAPFLAAVRSGFRGVARDRLGRVLAQAAPDLAELFPELGRATPRADADGAEQHRLGLAFHGLLATFAREAPVLLVIEDLHWADEASLALLQYLARELRDSRVLLLATYRSDEMHRRHPLLRVLAALQRERLVGEVTLRRLDAEQVRELIRATLAVSHPDVSVSDELRDAIFTRTEGNPFFTEELLKSLVESGGIFWRPEHGWDRKPIEQLQIPGSIREAVRAHVEGLSEEARATLGVAAVIGQRFEFETLRVARGAEESAIEEHVRHFIDAQLVVEVPGGEERYSFRHALTREVIYDDLLVRERKRVHRAVADALSAARGIEPSLLAYHLLAAGEAQRAVPQLLVAAQRAQSAGAPREAVAHYARAIEAGVPDERLAETIEHQAEAYLRFDAAMSIRSAEEALALYRRDGDRRGQSRMLRAIGVGHGLLARTAEARRHYQMAVDVLEGDECVELARATAALAGSLMVLAAMAECLPVADRAIELARRLHDDEALARALNAKGSALGESDEGLGYLREALDLALRRELVGQAMAAYNNLAIRLVPLDAADERRRLIDEGVTFGRRHGIERTALGFLLSQRAADQVRAGDWDGALATIAGMDETSTTGSWMSVFRGLIALGRDGPRPAAAEFARLTARVDRPAETIGHESMVAAAYAVADELDKAREHFVRAREIADRFPRGDGKLRTVRSALGGGPQGNALLVAALAVDDASIVDEAEAEILPGAAEVRGRALIRAARAVFAGDADAAARELAVELERLERSGVPGLAYWNTFGFGREAVRRGLRLGAAWDRLFVPMRAFAEKAGARWWLEQLNRIEKTRASA